MLIVVVVDDAEAVDMCTLPVSNTMELHRLKPGLLTFSRSVYSVAESIKVKGVLAQVCDR